MENLGQSGAWVVGEAITRGGGELFMRMFACVGESRGALIAFPRGARIGALGGSGCLRILVGSSSDQTEHKALYISEHRQEAPWAKENSRRERGQDGKLSNQYDDGANGTCRFAQVSSLKLLMAGEKT